MTHGKRGVTCTMLRKAWRTKQVLYSQNLCKYKGKIIEDCNNKLICEMNWKKSNLLVEEINKKLYIKLLKRKKLLNR